MKHEQMDKEKENTDELMRIEPAASAASSHHQLPTSNIQRPISNLLHDAPSQITNNPSPILIPINQPINQSRYAYCCSIKYLPAGTHIVHV
jgi:hypothetical protein